MVTDPSDPQLPVPPAGWYVDPEFPNNLQRYWDGSQWTDQRAPFSPPPAPANPWLVGAGYVLSLTVIGGLIVAAALFARRSPDAKWVLGLSLLMLAAFGAIGIWAPED